MPGIRYAPGGVPRELAGGPFEELFTLFRRSSYAGLLPGHPEGLTFMVRESLGFCRQVHTISENMQRAGLPAKPSFHRLEALPGWRQCLEGASGSSPVGWSVVWGEIAEPLTVAVGDMNEQIEMSPQPAGEWGPAIEVVGEDLLATLVGASPSSVRRYAAGARATPQAIAERLHFIAMLLADLAGSYNEFGIRRWFSRPRSALGGLSPAAVLGDGFEIDGEGAAAVRRLAAALTGAGAA